ncbi:translation initiation factor IF-2 subunit beta [Halobacterium wangiae]|uniref:translation initiation factor IF-2 subunit beta n=1 Tax=Halobacterium wangiae TaxID=2902623 RepID=UPI001E639D61|nr:translation initiation factor IF-2 subunit beta [Halobacterium wangiae]
MDYEEQLDRAMEEKPDIAGNESRFEVPEPNVRKEGNVTVYENFQSTLDDLSRQQDHVLKFIQNELGTSAQIDDRGRARFTGEFGQRRVEEVLDDYVDTYVICPECGLPDTNIEANEEGDERLHCEACGARSAV